MADRKRIEDRVSARGSIGDAELLQGRVDLLEQAVDASLLDNEEQSALRGRVRRLEETVGELYELAGVMDSSLKRLMVSRLKLTRALDVAVMNIGELSSLYGEFREDDRYDLYEETAEGESGDRAGKGGRRGGS